MQVIVSVGPGSTLLPVMVNVSSAAAVEPQPAVSAVLDVPSAPAQAHRGIQRPSRPTRRRLNRTWMSNSGGFVKVADVGRRRQVAVRWNRPAPSAVASLSCASPVAGRRRRLDDGVQPPGTRPSTHISPLVSHRSFPRAGSSLSSVTVKSAAVPSSGPSTPNTAPELTHGTALRALLEDPDRARNSP